MMMQMMEKMKFELYRQQANFWDICEAFVHLGLTYNENGNNKPGTGMNLYSRELLRMLAKTDALCRQGASQAHQVIIALVEPIFSE